MTKKIIDKKTLERLAELARIELKPEKEEKLLNDLEKILEYFEELKNIDTEGVEPMAGGTPQQNKFATGQAIQKNIFRDDNQSVKITAPAKKLIKQFPEKEDDFLKVPAVFE